jgi:hypothetical protein
MPNDVVCPLHFRHRFLNGYEWDPTGISRSQVGFCSPGRRTTLSTSCAGRGRTTSWVRVRSGGHCLEGWSNVDDGIVIGVSQMKSTKIGPSHTATVGAGLNQLEAVTELDKAGFAAPIGTEASVGLVAARLGDGTFAQGAIMVAPQPVTTRSFDVDDLQTEAVVERLLNRHRPCRRNSSRGVPLPRPPQHDTCHHRHRPARTSSAAGEMSVNQAQR